MIINCSTTSHRIFKAIGNEFLSTSTVSGFNFDMSMIFTRDVDNVAKLPLLCWNFN